MSQNISEPKQKKSRNRINPSSLQTRLVFTMLFVALIPLVLITTRNIVQTQQALTNAAEVSLKAAADQTANNLDNFVQKTLDSVAAESQLADIQSYLTLSVYTRTGSSIQGRTLDLLENLGKKDSTNIISYALVDTNGIVLLDSATEQPNNESTEPYFLPTQISNTPIVSYVTYEKDKTTSLTFASPIKNANGGFIGILRVKYRSTVLQDVIMKGVGETPDTSVILLDQLSIRLADTQNPELVLKSVVPLKPADYTFAVNNHRLLDTSPEEQATNYPDFESALDNAVNQPFFRTDITPNVEGDDTVAVAFMQTQPWVVAYSRPTSIFLEEAQKQLKINIILVIAASSLIVVAVNLLVRGLTGPILSLTETANAISQGDLSARADINTNDEIGILANTFNKMSAQIQELVSTLENRVEERTSDLARRSEDLQLATVQIEKRARQLETIAEISRFISTEKDQEKLLPLITQIVSERFGFYHVGIFLLDENKKYALLRASNSPGGQVMLRRQHKLAVGHTGIVGNVTNTGKPRVALDTGEDSVYFNNPDLPETRSEMAVPLTARGSIIGALDVQSTTPNAFTEEDVSIISLLADQLAIAIDNVRLLEDLQNSLAESQSIFTEYLANAWQKKSGSAVIGYQHTLAGGKVITANTPNEIILDNKTSAQTLAIPIQVRDQVIGTLNVRPNSDNKTWNQDEVNIVEAVAERLALALDNARLFEETSHRASRERLVSDITTKIRGTNDPQEMVKTAIEELQRALGATHIEIVPQKFTAPPDK